MPHRCGDRGGGREISREDGGKEQQRDPFSQGLAPTWPSHPGLYWLSSLFHHRAHRFIWREIWKLGIHTKHVGVYSNSGFLPTVIFLKHVIRINNSKFPPKQGIVGIIGRMLTSDGQQFNVLGKPSIIIGQTTVWTDFHIQLFLEPLTVMTTSESNSPPREQTSQSHLAEVTGDWNRISFDFLHSLKIVAWQDDRLPILTDKLGVIPCDFC